MAHGHGVSKTEIGGLILGAATVSAQDIATAEVVMDWSDSETYEFTTSPIIVPDRDGTTSTNVNFGKVTVTEAGFYEVDFMVSGARSSSTAAIVTAQLKIGRGTGAPAAVGSRTAAYGDSGRLPNRLNKQTIASAVTYTLMLRTIVWLEANEYVVVTLLDAQSGATLTPANGHLLLKRLSGN